MGLLTGLRVSCENRGRLNAELFRILGVQSLPAELHGRRANDAPKRLTREEPIENVETNMPPGSTH